MKGENHTDFPIFQTFLWNEKQTKNKQLKSNFQWCADSYPNGSYDGHMGKHEYIVVMHTKPYLRSLLYWTYILLYLHMVEVEFIPLNKQIGQFLKSW